VVDCDCDCGLSLRALDGAVVNGRDVRILGARNREDEASARVAKQEREVIQVICDRHMCEKRGQSKDGLIVYCQVARLGCSSSSSSSSSTA
jgi:hypothetical protein